MKNKPFIFLLAITYFAQGWESLPGQSLFVYMKNVLHCSPSLLMYLSSLIGISWLIKPLWGALIDRFATKQVWYKAAVVLSVLVALAIGMSTLPLWGLVLVLMASSLSGSIRDIAVDGMMVCTGKEEETTGKLQAIQWISLTVAGLITGLGGGLIAQYFNYKLGFLLLIPIYVIAAIILSKIGKAKPRTVEPTTWKDYLQLVTDKNFIWVCVFIFLLKYSPSFGTPLSYKIRDTFHWTEAFIGLMGSITSVISIAGAFVYFFISKRLNVRRWVIGSVIFNGVITLCYLYFTPTTAILYDILFSFSGMMVHLLILDFMARQTKPGLEATSFAMLCSVNNLAGTVSSLTGAWLLTKIGLSSLIVISSITTFLCLFCIPKIKFENCPN